MSTPLLDPTTLARYDGLGLHVRRGMGMRPGDRRFPGHPQPAGTELEAHAPYVAGDDPRHLDWNALGRLDTLVIRRFTAEREVVFHVLLDASASMGVPEKDGKIERARELAMALAYVALASNDAVRVGVLQDGAPSVSPLLRQRKNAIRVAERLAAVTPAGALDLAYALTTHARHHRAAGAALIVSDFMMDAGDVERGVLALRARGYDVHLLHILGTSDRHPPVGAHRLLLQDAESGATHPVEMTAPVIERYHALLTTHLAALGAAADRSGATYARLEPSIDVPQFVTHELPRLGLIRRR